MVLKPDERQFFLNTGCSTTVLPRVFGRHRAAMLLAYGFTLLEMLVVLVIIGLLTGYVAPRFFDQVGRSEIKVAKAQIDAFSKALDQYRLDMGRYPTTEQGLAALNNAPDKSGRWHGPYLSKTLPKDPWGNEYAYFAPGKTSDYDIVSYGRDGRPGGQGDDADIFAH